jgi:hypothetical protein
VPDAATALEIAVLPVVAPDGKLYHRLPKEPSSASHVLPYLFPIVMGFKISLLSEVRQTLS